MDAAGQPVWEEAAPGPRRLEGGVLVDVQGYPVDAEGYRLSNTTGACVQKVERAKLECVTSSRSSMAMAAARSFSA